MNLMQNIEEIKAELNESKRNCQKYLNQLIDEKKEEKLMQKKFYSDEEVENIKNILFIEKENAIKNIEYINNKEKGIK